MESKQVNLRSVNTILFAPAMQMIDDRNGGLAPA